MLGTMERLVEIVGGRTIRAKSASFCAKTEFVLVVLRVA